MIRLDAPDAAAAPPRPVGDVCPSQGGARRSPAASLAEFGGAWFGSGSFRAIGADIHLLTTDPATLLAALGLVREHLGLLDAAASRFREDSEVRRLARAGHHGPHPVSAVLSDYLAAALHAARITGGLVDPTVGAALVASGYDRDIDAVTARGAAGGRGEGADRTRPGPRPGRATVSGWATVEHDPVGRTVRLVPGTLLDLGASAKAHAADVLAALLADTLPGGFLVNLGGDVATSGALPAAGWQVGVEASDGVLLQAVSGDGQAFATSSTRLRRWEGPDGPRHHVVDPRTGRTAPDTWAQVTCAAATCLEANAASTAAVVLGEEAPAWLAAAGIPARLDRPDGRYVRTPGWPEPGEAA